jgi:hypothetical protein
VLQTKQNSCTCAGRKGERGRVRDGEEQEEGEGVGRRVTAEMSKGLSMSSGWFLGWRSSPTTRR